MGKFFKALTWLFLLGLIGYISYQIYLGSGGITASVTGMAVYSPGDTEELREVEVLSVPDCMDLDKGKEYYARGSTYNTYENIIHIDYCEDEGTLVEYFCNNQYPDRIYVGCDCLSGACR